MLACRVSYFIKFIGKCSFSVFYSLQEEFIFEATGPCVFLCRKVFSYMFISLMDIENIRIFVSYVCFDEILQDIFKCIDSKLVISRKNFGKYPQYQLSSITNSNIIILFLGMYLYFFLFLSWSSCERVIISLFFKQTFHWNDYTFTFSCKNKLLWTVHSASPNSDILCKGSKY